MDWLDQASSPASPAADDGIVLGPGWVSADQSGARGQMGTRGLGWV